MGATFLSVMHLGSCSLRSCQTVLTEVLRMQECSQLSEGASVFLSFYDAGFLPALPIAHVKCPSGVCFAFCLFLPLLFVHHFMQIIPPKYPPRPVLCPWHCLYPMRIVTGSHPHYVSQKQFLTPFKISCHLSNTW